MPAVEYKAYLRVLGRRWPLIIALALVAAGTAYGYGARSPRVYRATAQLSVTPSIVDYFTGEAIQRLLANYALRLKSKVFAGQYGTQLRPAESADQLAGKVKAVAAPSEYRIAIEVDDGDPVRAQAIANAAADAFVQLIRAENEGKEKRDISIAVLERADVPGTPFAPRPKRAAAGAAVAGAVIGVALAFLLEYWDDSVKTAAEAGALLGVPVLGTIPSTHARRPRLRAARVPTKRGAVSST